MHRLQSDLRFTEIQSKSCSRTINQGKYHEARFVTAIAPDRPALGLVTAGSVQAAETSYQGIEGSRTQNVALATNGAVATASSTGFGDTEFSSAGKLIDDTRSGIDSYWTDDTTDEFPDVVQINFFGNKTIDRVVVYSVQEELNNFGGIDPTDTDNCLYTSLSTLRSRAGMATTG